MNKLFRRFRKRPIRAVLSCSLGLLLAVLIVFLTYQARFFTVLAAVPFSRTYTDREGKLLNIFLSSDDKYRIHTPLGYFPPEFVQALFLQEDKYFYGHWGVNPGALFRAGWETYIKQSRRMGASTITMQLARLRFGLYTRTIPGKIQQICAALFLELCLTKDEILEAYLNLAPCGGNIEGYPAAAWYYFNKDIQQLTIGEMLSLVVIPQNPAKRAPLGTAISGEATVSREFLDARSALFDNWVLEHPEDELFRTEIALPPLLINRFPRRAQHHLEFLNTELSFSPTSPEQSVSPSRPNQRDRMVTTIDVQYQTLCEKLLDSYLDKNRTWGVQNGSILLLDHTTMEVLAAVGSADYFNDPIQGQVNGTTSKRSPGSTLKPFIYALAMDQGIIHPEMMLKDTPVGFSEYTPDNYQSQFKGPIKAWDALVDSRNVPAVYLASLIKEPDLYDFLSRSEITGLKEKDHYGLSIVLGSADLTMMELVSLYAALPNRGVKKDIRFLTNPEQRNPGMLNTQPDTRGARILSPESAWITLRMLERNPPPAEVSHRGGRIPVAYKTGTSIGFKDAWSIAVFDRYVLAVWIGNFSGEGNNAFLGRLMATPLLFNIVDALEDSFGTLPPDFMPSGVSEVAVCAVSGAIPGEYCLDRISTWFIPGVSPINRCHIHRPVSIDTRTGFRSDEIDKPYIRTEIREFWPTDLLEIFRQAGLPRFVPPPYPPEDDGSSLSGARSNTFGSGSVGFPPDIISPLANTDYVIRKESEKFRELVLTASSDQDGGELFWFANSSFLGRALPNEKVLWRPEPGVYSVSVVDSRGRSASVLVTIQFSEE